MGRGANLVPASQSSPTLRAIATMHKQPFIKNPSVRTAAHALLVLVFACLVAGAVVACLLKVMEPAAQAPCLPVSIVNQTMHMDAEQYAALLAAIESRANNTADKIITLAGACLIAATFYVYILRAMERKLVMHGEQMLLQVRTEIRRDLAAAKTVQREHVGDVIPAQSKAIFSRWMDVTQRTYKSFFGNDFSHAEDCAALMVALFSARDDPVFLDGARDRAHRMILLYAREITAASLSTNVTIYVPAESYMALRIWQLKLEPGILGTCRIRTTSTMPSLATHLIICDIAAQAHVYERTVVDAKQVTLVLYKDGATN
jgi:hypothetical protein